MKPDNNNDDFGAAEYIPREPRNEQERQGQARAKEMERRFRLQALERLPSDPARLERLRTEEGRALKLIRWALSEQANDARAIPLAVRAVIAACGSLERLELTHAELEAIIYGLLPVSGELAQAA